MQRKLNRICDGHMQAFLFWICWLVYFASYIGRLNYSSAMPAMIGDSVLTASQAGFISMAYFFAYGAGQFLNGMLADRLCPGRMIFTGLFAAGLLNLIMGFLSDFGLMAFFWCINGYAQAMIWPPIMRIFAQVMTKEKRERYCVHITSTMAVNTLFVNLLPLRFEKEGRVSTVSGFLNSTAYLGCAVSVYGIGVLIQGAGWESVVLCWLAVTTAALVICFVLRNKKFAAGSG